MLAVVQTSLFLCFWRTESRNCTSIVLTVLISGECSSTDSKQLRWWSPAALQYGANSIARKTEYICKLQNVLRMRQILQSSLHFLCLKHKACTLLLQNEYTEKSERVLCDKSYLRRKGRSKKQRRTHCRLRTAYTKASDSEKRWSSKNCC